MRKLHFFSILVALFLATSSLWAKPAVADANGKLPCRFSVSATKQVQFSQGNLQYNSTSNATQSPRWQFADEQYEYIGNTEGNTNITVNGKANNTGIADLFGWVGASSPWTDGLKLYGLTSSTTASDYGNVKPDNLNDWGNLAIFNGGNAENSDWRTLTNDEWVYMTNVNGIAARRQGDRFYKARVHDVNGVILFPDGWTSSTSKTSEISSYYINKGESSFRSISNSGWTILEGEGCVFLPAAGYREGTTVNGAGENGNYWAADLAVPNDPYNFQFWNTSVSTGCYSRFRARSVRLVQDASGELPSASVTDDPKARSGLGYTGGSITLVTAAGTATGGKVKYKLSTQGEGDWSTTLPSATNVGEYIVQWFVESSCSGCYVSSAVSEIHVTIARGTTSAPNPRPTISAATSLTYNGSAQDLVTATGDIQSGYTTVYSTDGVNWGTTIPQGTDAGGYTVYYKFYKGANYEYVPSPNTINASIAQADLDLSGVTLPGDAITIDYDGTAKTLLEIEDIPDCTIWYKLGDGEWTTTPPTRTDADDYSVQYKIVPSDSNYKTYGPETVTVTIFDYPTITDLTVDDATIASILTGLTDPWQLKVKRTIYADGEYNTICLPFAVSASDLADDQYPLYGYERLKTLKGAKVTGSGSNLSIDIFVEDVTEMEAGKPYLISYPSAHADIENPVFQLSSTTSYELHAGSVTADGVTFQGMFAQVHIDPYTSSAREQDYLFLGANSQLMWPNDDGSSMRGFRAYFIINRTVITPAAAPSGIRARFVNAPKQPTSIENTELNTQAQKLLENGQLIILKNGIKYNAQGQVLK